MPLKTQTEGTNDVEDGISGSVMPLSPGSKQSRVPAGKKLVIKGLKNALVAQSQVVGGK